MKDPYHYAAVARGELAGTTPKVDALVGIPPDARPWDLVKAVLPEGWGILLVASSEGDGWVRVASIVIGRQTGHGVVLGAPDSYAIALRHPIVVEEAELDTSPAWVDQELARRRAT